MSRAGNIKNIFTFDESGNLLWEVLDLVVDGSTPVTVSPTKDFDIISRVIWEIRFASSAVDWALFGADAALTNGINLLVDGVPLLDTPIKANGDLYRYGYDVTVNSDAKATPDRILSARWSFFRSVPGGLPLYENHTFGVTISDDLTALTNLDSAVLVLQGFKDSIENA